MFKFGININNIIYQGRQKFSKLVRFMYIRVFYRTLKKYGFCVSREDRGVVTPTHYIITYISVNNHCLIPDVYMYVYSFVSSREHPLRFVLKIRQLCQWRNFIFLAPLQNIMTKKHKFL